MNQTGVIIGRFQAPELHDGYHQMIKYVSSKHSKVIIVVGVSVVRGTRRNPYDYYVRERMLRTAFPHVVVVPLADHVSDKVWSQNLDALLNNTFAGESFVLYASRDSFKDYYFGSIPVHDFPQVGEHTSSEMRLKNSHIIRDNADFRHGINYACHNRWTQVYPTVDIAVFAKHGKETQLLLGAREDSVWRLPGGFASPTDVSFEDAAARELREEVLGIEFSEMKYVKSFRINDWRYRHEEDKTITILYKTNLVKGFPKAGDDLKMVQLISITEIHHMFDDGGDAIAADHQELIRFLLNI